MRLDEYQWSRNPRGLHNKAAPFRMDQARMTSGHYGWGKMVAIGGEYLDDIPWMLANNITPIIRIFRHNMGAAPVDNGLIGYWRAYAERGVKWFEFYNEPNLGNEWPNGVVQDYRNRDQIIAPLMDNWLSWAEMIISWGCYPAFPALAEAYGDIVDVGGWLDAMMVYLAERHYDRFRAVMNNGLWVATHPYIYNHFYQEQVGSPAPRPPDQENAHEGGWHFEYPYDPIMQSHRPGITTISGDAEYPHGDVIGVAGSGEAFLLKAYQLFGGGAIPVVGTEGGIIPAPVNSGSFSQIDNRYPGVTWNSHGQATLAMFNWIATSAPTWMFGITLWKENDYYEGPAGSIPAVAQLVQNPPLYKTVLPLDALGGANPGSLSQGPGPVTITPDYHFVMLAQGFNADWFFNGGSAYYEKFRPTMITNIEYIGNLPNQRSLGLTILATEDMGEYTKNQIAQRWDNVQIDLITVRTEERLATILRQRVQQDKRFG